MCGLNTDSAEGLFSALQEYIKWLMVGSLKNKDQKWGIETHTWIPRVQEAKAGGLKFKVTLGFFNEILSQKKEEREEEGRQADSVLLELINFLPLGNIETPYI